jgi:chromosome segregation ATPase
MKILTNAKYNEFTSKIQILYGELVGLQSKYGLLKANYDANENVIKEQNGRIGGLIKENNKLKEQLVVGEQQYKELVEEKEKMHEELSSKILQLEKKLEESLSDAYLRVKLPMGKLPKGQVMHMKSHAAKDKLIKRVYADLEKNK